MLATLVGVLANLLALLRLIEGAHFVGLFALLLHLFVPHLVNDTIMVAKHGFLVGQQPHEKIVPVHVGV